MAIATGELPEAGIRLDQLRPAGYLDGHQVVESAAVCRTSAPALCSLTFGVPDLDAYFQLSVWSDEGVLINEVRESLTLLDEDQTAVPPTPSYGELDKVVAAMEEAGLAAEVEQVTCPSTAFCAGGVLDVEPAAGSVVPTGSTVTVTVLSDRTKTR